MIRAALSGALEGGYERDPIFNLEVPIGVPDVPRDVLRPRTTWTDPLAYDRQARALARMFASNFETFAPSVSAEVVAAGPQADA
jgi:phosphoenolpyruvate carboxykinase (ATP)